MELIFSCPVRGLPSFNPTTDLFRELGSESGLQTSPFIWDEGSANLSGGAHLLGMVAGYPDGNTAGRGLFFYSPIG